MRDRSRAHRDARARARPGGRSGVGRRRRAPARVRARKGSTRVGDVARGSPRPRDPRGRGRRALGRRGAHSCHRVPDDRRGCRRRRRHLGVTQPSRVQRHQVLRPERHEAPGCRRGPDRGRAVGHLVAGRPRGVDPGPRRWPRAIPGTPRGRGGSTAQRDDDRRRLRERRGVRLGPDTLRAARGDGAPDPRRSRRAQHQRRLWGPPPGGRGGGGRGVGGGRRRLP